MQKQYNQTLFVEVPKEASHFELGIGWAEPDIPFFISYELNGVEIETKLPEGEWEIVNPLNEITEEQAMQIVSPEIISFGESHYPSFEKPYIRNPDCAKCVDLFKTALEALSSLATHLGFEKDANIIVLQKKN